jgi:hypothetical protein
LVDASDLPVYADKPEPKSSKKKSPVRSRSSSKSIRRSKNEPDTEEEEEEREVIESFTVPRSKTKTFASVVGKSDEKSARAEKVKAPAKTWDTAASVAKACDLVKDREGIIPLSPFHLPSIPRRRKFEIF